MTVEEAKQIIKDRPSFAYMSYTDRIQFSEALDVAVRSLEAWDKLRKEIASDGQSDINAKYVLNLIDKHLSEVSE